jgi:hypothetical protein
MLNLLIVGTVLTFSLAKHPVHKDHVDEIKHRPGIKWQPMEADENPLANYTEEQL